MVLAWGAINARHPSPDRPQVAFRVDYRAAGARIAAGFARVHERLSRLRGPAARWFAGCTMPDGSHWALQAWQRAAEPRARPLEAAPGLVEPRPSRWSGELPSSSCRRTGPTASGSTTSRLTYLGQPAYGYLASAAAPWPTASAGTSTSTRRTRPMGRAGSGEQLSPHPRYGRLLLRLLPARPVPGLPGRRAPVRPGRASATGDVVGPGVLPT